MAADIGVASPRAEALGYFRSPLRGFKSEPRDLGSYKLRMRMRIRRIFI
jgi:hypothetical protein